MLSLLSLQKLKTLSGEFERLGACAQDVAVPASLLDSRTDDLKAYG